MQGAALGQWQREQEVKEHGVVCQGPNQWDFPPDWIRGKRGAEDD